jgi:hypothetical protein
MACQIRDYQLRMSLQFGDYSVPGSRLIASAMQQYQQGAGAAMPHHLGPHRGCQLRFPKTGSPK